MSGVLIHSAFLCWY